MNTAHLDAVLTHAPIVAVLVGISVLIVALARRATALRRVAYVFFIAGALVAIPVFLSGQDSSAMLGQAVGAGASVIDAHARAARVSLMAIEMLGGLSLVTLVLEGMRLQLLAPSAAIVVVVGSLTTASLTYTANLGGQIRQAEIHQPALSAQGRAGPK